MITAIKALLSIGSVLLGGYLCNIAFTIKLDPYWLNTLLLVLGIGLAGGGVTYLLIKVIRRLIN